MMRDVVDGRLLEGGILAGPRSILDRVGGDEERPFRSLRSLGSTLGESVGRGICCVLS